MNTKQCSKCRRKLPREQFHSDKQKSDGKCSQCKTCKTKDVKSYYDTHKTERIEASRAYHAAHGDAINLSRRKHPAVSGRGEFNRLNPSHFDFGASLRKPAGESSFARLVRQYKANAARRGLEFELSDSEVRTLTSSVCNYCGVSPAQKMHSKDANGAYFYNGIDRVDSTSGYTVSNCVPCCVTCNQAKRDMSMEQWRMWLNRIICYHVAGNFGFKKTLERDDAPKSLTPGLTAI